MTTRRRLNLAAGLAVLVSASVALAQRPSFVPAGYCSGTVCFALEESCERYRSTLSDEGRAAAACRPARQTWSVMYYSTLDRDDMVQTTSTRAACEHARRELQRLNRGRRHLFEGIGECVEYHYVAPPDADHDGVADDADRCSDQHEDGLGPPAQQADGCTFDLYCFTPGSAEYPACYRTMAECLDSREMTLIREQQLGLTRQPTSCDSPLDAGVPADIDAGVDAGIDVGAAVDAGIDVGA